MSELPVLKGAIDLAKPIFEAGSKLLENLLGGPFKVAGQLAGDQIYYWQWRNRIRIASRAQQILTDKAIAARVLPAGFLLPLLDEAGNVEDENLQDLWARLLASGVASDDNQHPMFLDALRRLDRKDAEKFRTLCREMAVAAKKGLFLRTNARDVGRLVALHLLTGTPDPHPVELAGRVNVGMSDVRVTSFGLQFAEAVGLLEELNGPDAPQDPTTHD